MTAADDPMDSGSREDAFEKDVRSVFQETLGLIHIALVTHYQLAESEALELEKDLRARRSPISSCRVLSVRTRVSEVHARIGRTSLGRKTSSVARP
jgi:predicted secreted Zn-dependent protease